jgi:hypothetical protein
MIVSAACLIGLLAIGDVKKVIAMLLTFQHLYRLPILLVLVANEAVQCIQWHVLLRALGIRVPLRAQAFAYLVGEPTRVLPSFPLPASGDPAQLEAPLCEKSQTVGYSCRLWSPNAARNVVTWPGPMPYVAAWCSNAAIGAPSSMTMRT